MKLLRLTELTGDFQSLLDEASTGSIFELGTYTCDHWSVGLRGEICLFARVGTDDLYKVSLVLHGMLFIK